MNRDTLEALRKRVESQPDDENGRLTRELFAQVEKDFNDKQAAVRAQLVGICDEHGLTDEEKTKVLAAFDRGEKIEGETGEWSCPSCKGRKDVFVPGCIGGTYERCSKCYGSGKMNYRVKVPA